VYKKNVPQSKLNLSLASYTSCPIPFDYLSADGVVSLCLEQDESFTEVLTYAQLYDCIYGVAGGTGKKENVAF
jgi:hypothetical protein